MADEPVRFHVSDAASFGAAIREFRALRGMSQARLSELTGINRSYLSELEQGRTTEQLERLVAVFDHLGVRVTLTAEP